MNRPDAWDAARYAAEARFVSDLGADALALLAPAPGERILDLGCGDGALTLRLMDSGATVIGLDASPDMVAAARARGVDARLGDGADFALAAPVDAVFSNAALHWMTDPEAVFACVARSLGPGGRFVGEFGGHGNIAALRVALMAALRAEAGVETDLTAIWWYPTVDELASRLSRAGFVVGALASIPRPTPVAAGAEAWFHTLAAPALALAPEAARPAVARAAAALARPALCDAQGRWTADYVRLRFRAALAEPAS